MASLELWTEKYRPASTLSGEYVNKNSKTAAFIKEIVTNPQGKKIPLPNLLLSGVQGTGKTTLARALCNDLKIERGDIMEINASRENNVETVREKIVNFCTTWPIGDYKIIILDEFDGFGHAAQKILRGEMERHADSVRFILTCNYPNKILPALHSRVQSIHFDALDMDSYIGRMISILVAENVDFDDETLMPFINTAYPDLRKGINILEQHVINGKLQPLEVDAAGSQDYLIEMAAMFKEGRVHEARKLVCSQARPEDYEDIYRFFYQNVHLFSDSETGRNEAIIQIAQGLRSHAICADAEINLAATMIMLAGID